jgi:hypothetical protein
MPPLGAKQRAQLPDRAFAYIDSQGRRRLLRATVRKAGGREVDALADEFLHGMPKPEKNFQVEVPGLPTGFPPPRPAALAS